MKEVFYDGVKYYLDTNGAWYDEKYYRVNLLISNKLNQEFYNEKREFLLVTQPGFLNIKNNKPLPNKINYIFLYSTDEYQQKCNKKNISQMLVEVFKKNSNLLEYEIYNSYKLFLNTFLKYFKKIYNINLSEYVICVVPGHERKSSNTGNICVIANEIAKKCNSIAYTDILIRYRTIKSHLEAGKIRTIKEHETSVKINNAKVIKGKRILLLDDLTVTGTTLWGCSNLLLKEGAKEVLCFAFAKK